MRGQRSQATGRASCAAAMMSDNSVFISYRRGNGGDIARTVQEFLEGQGFDVFLDVDGLGSGHFDDQLLTQIAARRSFIFVCSEGSLDRCVNEGDWVRREIVHALKTRRHIVPFMMPRFVWPTSDALPQEMAEFQRHNAFEYSHSHWKLIKPKLAEMLRAKPANSAPKTVSELTPPKPADTKLALDWCDVVAADPDPAVVTDAAARKRMTATKLPWKVRDRKTGIVMLLCPPGEFMMGSPASEAGRQDNEAQHSVTITKAFYLSETEVTQEVWQKVKGANPSNFKGANNPVEQVSWNDCQSFCQSSGLRLASESEWEYACRAGTTGAYAGDLASMAWFGDNSGRSALDADALWKRDSSRYVQQLIDNGCQTHPVKQRKPNAWGLYDMHGNVWEWCEDGYAESASSTQQASTGNVGARVLRGGGWNGGASDCRSAYRTYYAPGYSNDFLGFRVARTSE